MTDPSPSIADPSPGLWAPMARPAAPAPGAPSYLIGRAPEYDIVSSACILGSAVRRELTVLRDGQLSPRWREWDGPGSPLAWFRDRVISAGRVEYVAPGIPDVAQVAQIAASEFAGNLPAQRQIMAGILADVEAYAWAQLEGGR